MESFVHLRKGRTPKRLHADLDGLKDDELGRGGFTGRTANIYRRHDPTAYRASGPLRPVDVLSERAQTGRRHRRRTAGRCCCSPTPTAGSRCPGAASRCRSSSAHVDGDLLCFVHAGAGLLETEFGPLRYREGDWVYLPEGVHLAAGARRRVHAADDPGHRRVPGATARIRSGGTSRSTRRRPPSPSPRRSTMTAATSTRSG